MKVLLVALVTFYILFNCSECRNQSGKFLTLYAIKRYEVLKETEQVSRFVRGWYFGLPGFEFRLHYGHKNDTRKFYIALELMSLKPQFPLVQMTGSATIGNPAGTHKIVNFTRSVSETHKTMDNITIMPLNDLLDNGYFESKNEPSFNDLLALHVEFNYTIEDE
jgi:hypothetical protein